MLLGIMLRQEEQNGVDKQSKMKWLYYYIYIDLLVELYTHLSTHDHMFSLVGNNGIKWNGMTKKHMKIIKVGWKFWINWVSAKFM